MYLSRLTTSRTGVLSCNKFLIINREVKQKLAWLNVKVTKIDLIGFTVKCNGRTAVPTQYHLPIQEFAEIEITFCLTTICINRAFNNAIIGLRLLKDFHVVI